jgi:hypothetical protein
MRMNGWHRLWVLVSVLGLIVCTLVVAALWPNEQSVTHSIAFYDALDPSARSQIAENESDSKEGVRMPNGHVIYLKAEVAASRKTEALLQYQGAVIAALHSKQRLLLAQVGAIWLAFCLTTLVLGHLVAWVVRGFRQRGKPSAGEHAP